MIKTFQKPLPHGTASLLIIFLMVLSSCNPTEISSAGIRSGSTGNNSALPSQAYVYKESPAILRGENYGPAVNIALMVDAKPEYITANNQLKGDCKISLFSGEETLSECIYSFASKVASQQVPARPADASWVFPTGSSEFYEVNALYHVQRGVNTFFEKLQFAYNYLYYDRTPTGTSSTPFYLKETDMYWFKGTANKNLFQNTFLSTYALCNLELNAQFNPAGPDLCFGKWAAQPTFLFVQDPSVVYHELGHALIAIMMNFRNGTPAVGTRALEYHPFRSNLGGYGYDEAGSIGEGVADYYSFVMNKRTHIGEWALKRALNGSRPMSEDDPAHISGINTTPEGRLSYPQYLLYDPNTPEVPYEDVHYAGQIVSHYLVALTKTLQTKCTIPSTSTPHDTSTAYVMLLLAETFSELGDLNAVGIDKANGTPQNPDTFLLRFNNLDKDASFLWSQVINPPTYRKFFQVFAKNLNRYMTNGKCQTFSKNESEKLLDDYGLLLFKTYNDNGSSTKNKRAYVKADGTVIADAAPLAPTKVLDSNRRKTVLVSKELLSLAEPKTDSDVATYYIIDDQPNMTAILENLLFKGYPMNPSTGVASVSYNNANIKISPGEIVAIIPNLFNASNSPMAGVHLLATDWDHVQITDDSGILGSYQPCVIDNVTTVAQGGVAPTVDNSCGKLLTTYRRHVKTAGVFRTDEVVAPVCLVQSEEGDVSRWVSQQDFRKKVLALGDKDCLGYAGTAQTEDFTFNPHECLVRVLPGANDAFFSKIDPQKSYIETMRTGNPDHSFGPGNAIIFEVNKWIQPGTKFRCRMRAQFSNCSDCHTSADAADASDDYIDAEYNGAKPFKIINIEFEVND